MPRAAAEEGPAEGGPLVGRRRSSPSSRSSAGAGEWSSAPSSPGPSSPGPSTSGDDGADGVCAQLRSLAGLAAEGAREQLARRAEAAKRRHDAFKVSPVGILLLARWLPLQDVGLDMLVTLGQPHLPLIGPLCSNQGLLWDRQDGRGLSGGRAEGRDRFGSRDFCPSSPWSQMWGALDAAAGSPRSPGQHALQGRSRGRHCGP
ncbi:unnamed protein product [Prorocentrum cordatum]|uniref:Uncharacterized protein n=1 Tax=Prorocentrum cordatum TaxID=2364126 RepID=A0ABN9WHU3_9DINO|nr:unnamed protein product [Polarella glacialis]